MSSAKSHISRTIASSWLSLIVVSACQLVMIPIALGALSKVDFALFAVISQMLMAIMLAEMGVRSACSRLLIDARAKGEVAYNKMWMASICVFCIQAAVMFVLIVALAPFLGAIFHLEPSQLKLARSIFLVVGCLNSLGYALSIFSTALYAGQRLSHTNLVAIVAAIVQMIGFIVAIKMGNGLWSYPIGMGFAFIVSNSLLISQVKKYKLAGSYDWKFFEFSEVKTVFKLGFDVFVAAVFSVVMGNSLLIFSGHLLTLEQTAILAVNLKLVNMMTQILQRVPGSAGPMLMKMVSEGNLAQFRSWWTIITKVTLFLALVSAGFFVIWNKWVVTLWTSEEMVMNGVAVVLLSLIPFRYLVHYQYVNSLTMFKEIRKVKLMLVWEILLYMGLAWWLGSEFGLMGLLSANLLSMLGGALFYGMRWFAYYSEITMQKLLELLLRLIVPLSVAFAIVYAVGVLRVSGTWFECLSVSILWVALFSLVGYFIILDLTDRQQLLLFLKQLKLKLKKASC